MEGKRRGRNHPALRAPLRRRGIFGERRGRNHPALRAPLRGRGIFGERRGSFNAEFIRRKPSMFYYLLSIVCVLS
jgi:hypothetical protein